MSNCSLVEFKNGNFAQPTIPRFDRYYDHWALLMENLQQSKEYWSIVEGGVRQQLEAPTTAQKKNVEESKLKELKA